MLGEEKYALLKNYCFKLATFGLEFKQIAYLFGNQITASVVGRYVKELYNNDFLQKPITTYFIKVDKEKPIIFGKLDYEEKRTAEQLLNQDLIFYKFGTKNRTSLENAVRSKKTKSRKK